MLKACSSSACYFTSALPLPRIGDVIVYINDICVLGTTHADVVKLFQSVPIGQSVTLVLCRGYPLPYDPEEPSASSTVPPLGLVDPSLLLNGRSTYDNYMEYMSLTGRLLPEHGDALSQASHPGDTHLDGSQPPSLNTPGPLHDDAVSMASSTGVTAGAQAAPEILSLTMTKGNEGFGFTIADSPTGQRVKQVQNNVLLSNMILITFYMFKSDWSAALTVIRSRSDGYSHIVNLKPVRI